MKVRVVYNSKIPGLLGAEGVTLYPFIFFRDSKPVPGYLLLHEMIHIRQYRAGGIGFVVDYIWEWFKGIFKYWNFDKAYRKNPYEQEAYRGQFSGSLTNEEKAELWD